MHAYVELEFTELMVFSAVNPNCEGFTVQDARICASKESGIAHWLRILSKWESRAWALRSPV